MEPTLRAGQVWKHRASNEQYRLLVYWGSRVGLVTFSLHPSVQHSASYLEIQKTRFLQEFERLA